MLNLFHFRFQFKTEKEIFDIELDSSKKEDTDRPELYARGKKHQLYISEIDNFLFQRLFIF